MYLDTRYVYRNEVLTRVCRLSSREMNPINYRMRMARDRKRQGIRDARKISILKARLEILKAKFEDLLVGLLIISAACCVTLTVCPLFCR